MSAEVRLKKGADGGGEWEMHGRGADAAKTNDGRKTDTLQSSCTVHTVLKKKS